MLYDHCMSGIMAPGTDEHGMRIAETELPGVWEIHPHIHGDHRGWFTESYRQDLLEHAVGHPLSWVQGNTSVSKVGTIRGLHYSIAPGGQAKYVTCTHGMVWDVAVDVREGSPTFGRYASVTLNAEQGTAVYIPAGFAHGFVAMTDNARVSYLVSTPYAPEYEFGISPFDESITPGWVLLSDPILSEKDRTAPTLAQAEKSGDLPVYSDPDKES